MYACRAYIFELFGIIKCSRWCCCIQRWCGTTGKLSRQIRTSVIRILCSTWRERVRQVKRFYISRTLFSLSRWGLSNTRENWELFIQKIHIARHFIVREWSDFSDNEIQSLDVLNALKNLAKQSATLYKIKSQSVRQRVIRLE